MNRLKDITPEEQWEQRCNDEIKASVDFINELKYGRKVFEYLGHSNSIKGHYAGFGKFLNSIRSSIGEVELFDLTEQLYRILFFQEELEQLEAARAEAVKSEESAEPTSEAPSFGKDAKTVYQKRLSMKPKSPKLPLFFNAKLADNAEAVSRFYAILHRCGFYVGRTLLPEEKRDKTASAYDGWKWKHLREAFMTLGFIRKAHAKKALAEYFAQVFPYLDPENVKRGFNSRGTYEDPSATARVVREVVAEFSSVTEIYE